MKRGRPAWLFPIAAAVLLALGAGTWIWLSLDEDPPPDADLREPRTPVPDAENGFLVLSAHLHLLDLPDEERKPRDPFGEGWEQKVAEAALARNAAALRGLEDSLRAPAFRAPETFLANPDCRGQGIRSPGARADAGFDHAPPRGAGVLPRPFRGLPGSPGGMAGTGQVGVPFRLSDVRRTSTDENALLDFPDHLEAQPDEADIRRNRPPGPSGGDRQASGRRPRLVASHQRGRKGAPSVAERAIPTAR